LARSFPEFGQCFLIFPEFFNIFDSQMSVPFVVTDDTLEDIPNELCDDFSTGLFVSIIDCCS
jgi:hypothetical protein